MPAFTSSSFSNEAHELAEKILVLQSEVKLLMESSGINVKEDLIEQYKSELLSIVNHANIDKLKIGNAGHITVVTPTKNEISWDLFGRMFVLKDRVLSGIATLGKQCLKVEDIERILENENPSEEDFDSKAKIQVQGKTSLRTYAK